MVHCNDGAQPMSVFFLERPVPARKVPLPLPRAEIMGGQRITPIEFRRGFSAPLGACSCRGRVLEQKAKNFNDRTCSLM
jgi:hypothetical protein